MFCYNCGIKTDSSICPECGTEMVELDSKIIRSWRKESDFTKIAKHPDVIELISDYSKFSNEKISSEYLLDKFDLVFGTFTGVPTNFLMEIAVPIYSKLRIKKENNLESIINEPINEIFVKVLCAISANKKLEFKEFHQAKDGLIIVSNIKADLLSFKGSLIIELQQSDSGVAAKINAVIKGQFFDYGKSKRIISKVLTDIKTIKLPQTPGANN